MPIKKKKISIIGLGYIGLPTAGILASSGYSVVGVDLNPEVVEVVNNGGIHIIEPGLEGLIRDTVASGKLCASTEPKMADIYLICVPTPFKGGESAIPQPNLEYVLAAAKSISTLLKSGDLVILESTSPVGTTEKIEQLLRTAEKDIHVAYCPERVLPGNILHELIFNDRIVGGTTKLATSLAGEFYRTFVRGEVLESNSNTAEMCKLTENAFRDLNIAFANELSMLCGELKINVNELIALSNRHPRVNILQPGPGVGGHCIAVDPWFIVSRSPNSSVLIRSAREVNNKKTDWVLEEITRRIEDICAEKSANYMPTIACLGLAFKANIDDLRESPALSIVTELAKSHINLIVVEPNISKHSNFLIVELEEALQRADLIVALVAHREFTEAAVLGHFVGKNTLDFCGALSQGKII